MKKLIFLLAIFTTSTIFGQIDPDAPSKFNKGIATDNIEAIGNIINLNNNIDVNGDVTASSFKTPTGTSSQFLKADGSVDNNTYLTTETDPIYSADPASGITTTDITNWNAAEPNVNADWDAVSGDAEILNKPSETNFSIYNQFSEVVVNTTGETTIVTADSGVLSIANITQGASYIGAIYGNYNHTSSGQNIGIKIIIGNGIVLDQLINTGTQTGTIPFKIDYTINFTANGFARISFFATLGTTVVSTVETNTTVISVGNQLNIAAYISAGTLTVYSSYLHKHVQ